jgi:hypothetical protein
MKTLSLLPVFLGLAAVPLPAAETTPSRISVEFDHPEKFTDVRDAYSPSDKGRDAILSNIRQFVEHRADRLLPPGDSLKVTFTDIKLAGDYEPWRGPNWDNVRIVKPIYPPDLKFTYSVRDASGRVVKQGSDDLRDLDFQMRGADPSNDDPLRYEKSMLGDWLQDNLRKFK